MKKHYLFSMQLHPKHKLSGQKLSKTILSVLQGFLAFYAIPAHADLTYKLSTFVDMSPGSAFAQRFCPTDPTTGLKTCAPEGSLRGLDGNLYVAMALPKGTIMKITPQGQASIYATFPLNNANPTAVDFNSVNLRLATDIKGNLYTAYISVTDTVTKTPSVYNGIWKIPVGGGHCDLNTGPCTKIWPQPNQTVTPVFQFGDGITLDQNAFLTGKGYIYVADAQMGNIIKLNLAQKTANVWAGVDVASNPNYLEGDPGNFVLGGPASRGLGVISLAIDQLGKNIYATNFDGGSIIRIPINKDGTAGMQQKLLDVSTQDRELDAIYLDPIANVLYATNDNMEFHAFLTSFSCAFSNPPTCSLVLPQDGHRVYAGFLGNGTGNVTFNPIIDNSILGTVTSVAPGDRLNFETLYLDVFSSTDGTGPKILRAVPAF